MNDQGDICLRGHISVFSTKIDLNNLELLHFDATMAYEEQCSRNHGLSKRREMEEEPQT